MNYYTFTAYELALIAGGFTILGALIGNWVSHRFSDYRDRRKERNEAADVLDASLRKERNGPSPISMVDFSAFERHLRGCELRRFRNCTEKYRQAHHKAGENIHIGNSDPPNVAEYRYHDGNPIILVIDELRKFTERK